MKKDYTMSWYFDRGLERNAELLDGSNLNWNEFPLYSCLKNELKRIEEGQEYIDIGYSYPGGSKELRSLISKHESFLEKTEILPQDVIINGGGATGVLNHIAQFIKNNGKNTGKTEIILSIPFYGGILKALEYHGLKVIYVNTERKNNFQPTFQQIKDKLTKKTAAILITTPGNPACCNIDKDEFKSIIDLSIMYDCFLIIDAIFEEAPTANGFQNVFKLSKNYDKLVKIKGFSKDSPQLNDIRIGWSICKNQKFNEALLDLSEVSNYSSSSILERIAVAEVKHRVWHDELKDNKTGNNTSLEIYLKELNDYHKKIKQGIDLGINVLKFHPCIEDLVIPEVGNILFAKVNPEIGSKLMITNSHELFEYFLNECNILISPGHIFGMPYDTLWFRITMSRSPIHFVEEITKLLRSLERGL